MTDATRLALLLAAERQKSASDAVIGFLLGLTAGAITKLLLMAIR